MGDHSSRPRGAEPWAPRQKAGNGTRRGQFLPGQPKGAAMSSTTAEPRTVNPFHLPFRKWVSVLWKTACEFIDDDMPSVAGGVTFFVLLAFFPALSAFVSLYGLFADVNTAREHLNVLRGL